MAQRPPPEIPSQDRRPCSQGSAQRSPGVGDGETGGRGDGGSEDPISSRHWYPSAASSPLLYSREGQGEIYKGAALRARIRSWRVQPTTNVETANPRSR